MSEQDQAIYELTIWCPGLSTGAPKNCLWQLRNHTTNEPSRYGVHYDPDYPLADREDDKLSQTGQEFVGTVKFTKGAGIGAIGVEGLMLTTAELGLDESKIDRATNITFKGSFDPFKLAGSLKEIFRKYDTSGGGY